MKLSDAEWRIMNSLWESESATAREILEKLPSQIDWAYSTVKTMLSRLVGKKAVAEEKRGNISLYRPLISRNQARRNALDSLMEKAFGGSAAPLLYFVARENSLNEKQRLELLKLLEEEEKEQAGEPWKS